MLPGASRPSIPSYWCCRTNFVVCQLADTCLVVLHCEQAGGLADRCGVLTSSTTAAEYIRWLLCLTAAAAVHTCPLLC